MEPLFKTLLAASLIAAPLAGAQAAYPDKPITMIVPLAPGGPSSILARLLTDELAKELKQTIIVDNRPGASGSIGARRAANAAPDGYTLIWGTTGTHAVNTLLHANLDYDPLKDFAPIALAATAPNIVAVNPAFPAKTVAELIQMAKTAPGKYDSAAAGVGTSVHMTGELFKQMAGIQINHVQYQGSAPALTDVIAGHVPIVFDVNTTVMPHIRSGKLRGLGVSSKERLPNAPELPTIAETIPGFESTLWYGVFAPAGTPDPVLQTLSTAVNAVLAKPEIKQRFIEYGAIALGSTPAELHSHVATEIKKWDQLIKSVGIKVQ